jgi:hypothetical protein
MTPLSGPKIAVTQARNWKARFVSVLSQTGVVKFACRASGVSRQTAYQHYRLDEGFREQWDAAIEEAGEALEGEARRRAFNGWDEPIFGSGQGPHTGTQQVGVIRKYDSALLRFLLSAIFPEKYRGVQKQQSKVTTLHWDEFVKLSEQRGVSDAGA